MPSSSTIWQARSTLMLSPSGNTMRLGAFFARCTIRRMIVYCVPPVAALQPLAVLVDVERQPRRRPTSSPPRPPPARTHHSTRVSNGLGMM